jgi:hypothetical protein
MLKLPVEVQSAVDRLVNPETPYDNVEIGGWYVTRVWEDPDSADFEVIATLIVARMLVSPSSHASFLTAFSDPHHGISCDSTPPADLPS